MERVENIMTKANMVMPNLPYMGFAFWFAWNLVAFSGSIWISPENNSGLINYFFIFHLAASVVTLLTSAALSKKLGGVLLSGAFIGVGAALGIVGTCCMIAAGKGYVDSFALFVIGSVFAGVGTSAMIVRSGILLSFAPPRRSFHLISVCAIVSIATYFVIEGSLSPIRSALFAALPALSAAFLSFAKVSAVEVQVVGNTTKLPVSFRNLAFAIFIYSVGQGAVKSAVMANLPAGQYVLCMNYVMFALIVLMVVFIFINLMMSSDTSVGKVFYPFAVAFIVPQVATPFLDGYAVAAAAGIDFAGYGFDLFVWSMAAYLAYQTGANCVRIFCYCTASLSLGLTIGNFAHVAFALFGLSSDPMFLFALSGICSLLSLIVTVIVFPETKLYQLFKPVVDETVLDSDALGKKRLESALERAAQQFGLSKRESEIMCKLYTGLTAQQIADELVISVYTVRAHTRKIYEKTGVNSKKKLQQLVEGYL